MLFRSVRERIWTALEEADVEIAYPHQHLLFDEHSGTARVAVEEGSEPPSAPEDSGVTTRESVESDEDVGIDDAADDGGGE